jgi:hypothetical protein
MAFTHPQLINQTQAVGQGVGKAVVAQAAQVWVLAAPAEFGELVVGRAAHQHRVVVRKRLGQAVKGHDLGRAHEGEIFGVEVDDLPLARETFFGEVFKSTVTMLLVVVETGLNAHHLEGFQFVTNGFHRALLHSKLDHCQS